MDWLWNGIKSVGSWVGKNILGLADTAVGAWSAKNTADASQQQIQGQYDTNAQNVALSREQMAFQERMSNTSHQREVEDLKKAGLNPVLSAHGGASTPSGALASLTNPYQNYAENTATSGRQLREGVNSSVENLVRRSMLAVNNSSAKQLDSMSALNTAKIATEAVHQENMRANTVKTLATAKPWELAGIGIDELKRLMASVGTRLGTSVGNQSGGLSSGYRKGIEYGDRYKRWIKSH